MKRIFCIIALALCPGLFLTNPAAAQKKATEPVAPLGQAAVGSVTVTLDSPEGLTRVDGLNPIADAYIEKVAPKLKLRVLAVYAVPNEWNAFVKEASAGKPTAIPRYAMICTTRKMAKKKFNTQTLTKENRSYARWFELVAGNRPMAALLTAQGNSKLKEILGTNIGFKFKVGEDTKKIAETSSSLSLGARTLFEVFGQPSDVYLTATSLGVGDKIVFLAYFEKYGPPAQVTDIQAKTLAWRDQINSLNADQYKK